jgi:hypothetical protein
MRKWFGALAAAFLAGGMLVVGASPSEAACHAFTIKVSPASVTEGAAVKVTVSRDGAVNPSSIHVSSVDETATAGSDYSAVDKTVSFTNDTEQSFNVATTNDAAVEPSETFRLHMSNPGGCAVNPNFSVGPDAKVTIADNDQIAPAPTTTAKPIANPTTTKPGQTTTSAVTTTTPPPTTTEETTTTSTATIAIDEDDDSSPAAAIALGIGAVAALGAIGYLLYRRRNAADA